MIVMIELQKIHQILNLNLRKRTKKRVIYYQAVEHGPQQTLGGIKMLRNQRVPIMRDFWHPIGMKSSCNLYMIKELSYEGLGHKKLQQFLGAGFTQLETECYKKSWGFSESVLRGFKRNCIILDNRIYEPSLIGDNFNFCGQDLDINLYNFYSGAGSIQTLALQKNVSKLIIRELKEGLWIKRGTRYVSLDFNLYNANVNLFCVVK